MPAVCDPVAAAIRQSLDIGQTKSAGDDVSISLTSGASKILQSEIKYEKIDDYQTNVLDNLKTKYTVLSLPKINERNNNNNNNQMDNNNDKMKENNNVLLRKKNDNNKIKNGPSLPEPSVILYPSDKIQLGWKGTFPVGAGMYNVGNTCYLNSTLQALFHVPALVNWLLSDTHHNSKCEQNGGGGGECLTCAMLKTLQFSHQKSGNAIKPFYICNKLKLICRTMVPGQQEDAHEFLRYLLEGMERAYLNRNKASKLDSYSKETTPINQIFGGYIRTEVRCLHCRHVSTTFSHFQDLLVDIRKASTLDEALSNYFSREQLDNNDYKCESCKRRVPATKQFSLEKPPKVLCVQLKRFSVLGGKISRHIGFKQTIDMGQYLWRENNEQPRKLNYKLMSIVTHMGPSVNCGHYTAIAQVSTGQYYTFDDASVRSINFSNVMNTNPYIMIFEMESSSHNQLINNQPIKLNTFNNNNIKTITNNCNTLKLSSPKPLTSAITTTTTPTIKNGHTNGIIKTREPDMPIIGPQLPPPPPPPSSSSTNFIGPQLPPQKMNDKSQPKIVMHIKNSKTLNSGNSLVPYDGSSDEDDNTTATTTTTTPTVKNINTSNNNNNNSSSNNNNNNNANNINKVNNNTNGIAKSTTKDVAKLETSKASIKSSNLPQKSSALSASTTNGNDNIKNGNDKLTADKQQQQQNGKTEIKTETNGKDKLQQPIKIKTCPDDRVLTKAASSINGWEVSKDEPSPASAATPNGWSVTDNNKDDTNKKSNNTSTNSSVPSAAAPRSFNGTNRSETVSHLLKMSNRGYGNPSVTSWNGNRTHLDREVDNERREERKRHYDEDDEEMDRGRCRKIKSHREYDGRSNPGYNPFQEYQNGKSWNNRSSSGGYHRRNGSSYYNTSSNSRGRHGGGSNHRNHPYRHHNNHSSRDHWQRR